MKYIFVVGAPGSRWSGVAKSIYYSDQIDQTDDTPERTYYNPKSPAMAQQLMHRGAYFDPGMEFGNELEDFDTLSKEDLEKLSKMFTDPIVLVYRHDEDCYDWWKEAGGWDITYPNYKWYKDDDTIKSQIALQNHAIKKFVHTQKLYSLNNSLQLQKYLGIKAMGHLDFTDVEVYCKMYHEQKNS